MTARVLHVLDHSLPLHSGYAFRTASILREQRALGYATLAMTTPRQGEFRELVEEAGGFVFHRTPFRRNALSNTPGAIYAQEMAATTRALGHLVDTFHPDVLHAHSPVLNALPALAVGRRKDIPVVYELRALWEDAAVDHGTTHERSARYKASRALETFALRCADHVTTICEGLRDDIAERGIADDRITVIPNAVDTDAFRLDRAPDPALRRSLGLDGRTVIGFAGSFFAYEGLDLLIAAFARLAPQRPELRLLLVGGGREEQALKAQAEAAGVASRIVFSGRVEHKEVGRYYDLIDVVAYPRHRMRLTELVTPLKPLEAMAQGRMLVASDVGGHRELVRDGVTGFLFPAGDAEALAGVLCRVLDARDDWPRMRAAARAFVERERTWQRSVARYAGVYAQAQLRHAPAQHVWHP